MQKKRLSLEEVSVIDGNNGLSQYLLNLQIGREATPRSWLYEGQKAEDVLNRWIPLMKKGNSKSPYADVFNMFDLSQVKKFGPQGAIPPFESNEVSEVIEPLYSPTKYDDPLALSCWFDKAEQFGKMVFRSPRRGKRLSPERVVLDMKFRDALNTNSGWPRFTRRSKVEGLERNDAVPGLAFSYPAIVLFRFYYGKLRPVWMFPMATNLIEMSFQQPIQHALQESPLEWVRGYLTPWDGYEYVKEYLTSQWHGQLILGGDTTKMDAHMRPAQLRLFFEIVKWYFVESEWDLLYDSIKHVNEIDLLVSDKYKIVGTHGLASGSAWTQLSETVLQLFMAWNVGAVGQGIGDDFYWLKNMTADQLVEYLSEFGLPANSQKQSVEEDQLTFLQRMNHQGFFSRENARILGGYYPTVRALCSMLLPEKFHRPKDWDIQKFCVRNYVILENCVDDPCFDEFLKFTTQGHSRMIPFAKQKASVLNAIQKEARGVSGLFPSYNQEKLSKPLAEYVSIKLARTL